MTCQGTDMFRYCPSCHGPACSPDEISMCGAFPGCDYIMTGDELPVVDACVPWSQNESQKCSDFDEDEELCRFLIAQGLCNTWSHQGRKIPATVPSMPPPRIAEPINQTETANPPDEYAISSVGIPFRVASIMLLLLALITRLCGWWCIRHSKKN